MIDAGSLVDGDNVVAVEVHQAPGSSDTSFDLSVEASDEAPPTDPVVVINGQSTWSYLDDGSDQGTAWRQPGFDDSAWATGRGQLGFGDGDENTVMEAGHVTYYARHRFDVADPDDWSQLAVFLLADDGAAVYLNGVEIVRDNLPPGPLTASTPAADYRWGADENTYHPIGAPADPLVAGTNVLAVEVHQAPGSCRPRLRRRRRGRPLIGGGRAVRRSRCRRVPTCSP